MRLFHFSKIIVRSIHLDIKPNSPKFIMMYKTVSIAVCCIIAAVICIANHRQYTNGSPARLETLLRNPHLSSSSLNFHDGPSSTIKDEPLSTKSPHELGVAHITMTVQGRLILARSLERREDPSPEECHCQRMNGI